MSTPKESSTRCKLSVIAEAVAECSSAVSLADLQPYNQHFHPTHLVKATTTPKGQKGVGSTHTTLSVVPADNPVRIQVEEYWHSDGQPDSSGLSDNR